MRGAEGLLAEVMLPAGEIELTIDDGVPVFASTFPIGARAAAALGACGVAAALLWRDRTGREQVVEVDARRAEVSLVSFLLQRLDGAATRVSRVAPSSGCTNAPTVAGSTCTARSLVLRSEPWT